MERNMDLVRTILMRLESGRTAGEDRNFGILGFTRDQIGYHTHIMMQEGLLEGVDVTTQHSQGPEAIPTNLTWKGHEFLDLARDQDRWNRAKALISKVGGAPIAVWVKVLTDLTMKGVELPSSKVN
ncbi:MAG: DUF2513 domain-containing protein [Gemmataceae bacterium]|nr:DUF2513 domain-containing protein [Gemmataceae bacterium]